MAFQFSSPIIRLDEIDGYYTESDVPRLRRLIEQYDGGVEHFILVGERPQGQGSVIHRESFESSLGEKKKSRIGIYVQTRKHGYVSGNNSGWSVHSPLNFVLSSSFKPEVEKIRAREERKSSPEGKTHPNRLQTLIDLFVRQGKIKTNNYLVDHGSLDFLVIFHLGGYEVFNRKGQSQKEPRSN